MLHLSRIHVAIGLHLGLIRMRSYAICLLLINIFRYAFLLRLIIDFVDIFLCRFFHFPHFIFLLELEELKLHFLERSMSHDSHVDNYIEGGYTNHRPADIVLKFRIVHILSEHK